MRMAGVAAAGVLAVLLAACAAPKTSPPELVAAPSVLVTNDKALARTHEGPSLIQDNADLDRLYLSEVEIQNGECRFYTSPDRGATWAKVQAPRLAPFLNCGPGSAPPQNLRTELQQAKDGTIYYAFHANDPSAGGTRSVLLGRSVDRGRSWTTAVVVAGPKATTREEIEVNFEAHLAIDPAQPKRIYVAWRRSFPGIPGRTAPTRPFMAVSDDGGATFGAPFMMFDKNIGFDGPRLFVVDGALYTLYRESAAPAVANQPVPETKVLIARSQDGGKTWAESRIASALDASEPIGLHDAARKLFHVTWHDNRNRDLDAFYAQSTDGVTWSEPLRLNDDPKGNRAGQYYPQLALSSTGRIDVAFYDYRDDPYPPPTPQGSASVLTLGSNLGKGQSVYQTSSYDGGKTWTRNVRVNDVRIDRTKGTWNGQYFLVVPPAIVSGNAWTAVAWSDTRNGDSQNSAQDIYTAIVTQGRVAERDRDRDLTGIIVIAALSGLIGGAGLALLFIALRRRGPRPRPPA